MRKILFSILLSFYVSYIYAYDIEINGLRYNVISLTELTAALVGVKDKYPEEFTIPESIVYNSKELTITAFDSRAFSYHKELKVLTIPATIKSISNESFNGCTSLKKLIFKDSSTPINLGYKEYESTPGYDGPGQGLFYDCPLEYLYMGRQLNYTESDYGYYGYSPFYGNKTLNKVICSDNVTKIGKCMFEGCSALSDFTFSDNITSIEYGGLSGCSITNGKLPKKLKTLGAFALGYNQIENLILPESLKSIGTSSFHSNTKLRKIIIRGLQSLGNSCFSDCSNISEIYSYVETPPTFTINNGAAEFRQFENTVFMNAKIFVPTVSLEQYKLAKGWENFWNISTINGDYNEKKCAKPSISLVDGIIHFYSPT